MYILGINAGHDASVCLLEDDRVVYAITEERLTQVKHQAGFPHQGIVEVLKIVKPTDISFVAFSHMTKWDNFKKEVSGEYVKKVGYYGKLFKIMPPWVTLRTERELRKTGITAPIRCVEHHIAHQYSGIAQSGFTKAISVSLDAWGDYKSYLANIMTNGELEYITHASKYDSVGAMYTAATLLCGFESNEGEGKTMGLAPFGKPTAKSIFQRMVAYKNLNFYTPERMFKFTLGSNYTQMHIQEKSKIFDALQPYTKEDIAASAQEHLEEMLMQLTEDLVKAYGIKDFIFSGGVFLNCVANGKILKNMHDVFIQPNAGDAGLSLGAAYKVYFDVTGKLPSKQVESVYYGNEFSDEEIKDAIKKAGLKAEKADTSQVASYLSKGRIVGWFQGKDEWGPRALGNRSILADPRRPENKDIVNNKVKHRESWRPFCPSLLEEYGKDYFEDYHYTPFMILNFKVKNNKIPAAMHIDKTARPQTVSKKQNERYYNLLKEFNKITRVPVLVNTSYNLRGFPMVHRPEEAIRDYLKTEMDVLVLGDYLLRKK